MDWVKGKMKAKYTYTMELPPTIDAFDGFIVDPNKIQQIGKETFFVIKSMIHEIFKITIKNL